MAKRTRRRRLLVPENWAPYPGNPPPASRTYRRNYAVAYARRWWYRHNPNYLYFRGNDCTNFVSQCVFAGGSPLVYHANPTYNWWYKGSGKQTDRWSLSWTTAHSFYWFLATSAERGVGLQARPVSRAKDLKIGDLISYDWQNDGRWDHTAIVVAHNRSGEPLVSFHTPSSWQKHWRYTTSRRYDRNKTVYRFWHILDRFA